MSPETSLFRCHDQSGTVLVEVASFGQLEILPSEEVDAVQVRRRVAERRETLRSEVVRAEGKLSNQGFVSNAPADVVEAEREKLAAYRAELEELD